MPNGAMGLLTVEQAEALFISERLWGESCGVVALLLAFESEKYMRLKSSYGSRKSCD